MTRFNRRSALKLLAASGAGGALPWLRSPSALGQADDVPLRILFIEAGSGVRRGSFEPEQVPREYVTEPTVYTDWAFREVMSALAPYRDRSTMFDQLDMVSATYDPTPASNAHNDGLTHMLTATDRLNADLSGGISIDQLIAQSLADQGVLTRLPSLEVMATDDAGYWSRSAQHHSYSAPGQNLPYLTYIPDIWDRLFPEPLTEDSAATAALNARRQTTHDFVRGDYERLVGRLGGEDREKIQQMMDYRAELHQRLGVVSDREFNRPDSATILDPWSELDEGYQLGNLDNRNWKTHAELIGKMAAAALHTDTTRVVNFSLQPPPDYEVGYTPGQYGTQDQHDLDHKASGDEPELTDPAAVDALDESRRIVYSQVRFVLDELASLQETDGQSLLDHTLVVVYSHIAEGSHSLNRLPWVIVGDAHRALKTGQYIRFPITATDTGQIRTGATVSERVWSSRGRPHNDLFVTIASAMGIELSAFGRSDMPEAGGIISEMLA